MEQEEDYLGSMFMEEIKIKLLTKNRVQTVDCVL